MRKPYENRFPWQLDWNLLRVFVVIVEERSITRAADFLGLTQPTVSAALQRLERRMGQRLVKRSATQFAVTEAGAALYREARAMLDQVSQLPGRIGAAATDIRGHVALAVTSHVVSPHFDRVLAAFARDVPSATLSIAIAESAEVLARVRNQSASLGVCLMRAPEPALTTEVLYRERFGLYCGAGHRLFGMAAGPEALAGEASVSFQTDEQNGPLAPVTRLRALAGMQPYLRGVSPSLHEVRRMILAGIGIGALPAHVAAGDVAKGRLWPLTAPADMPQIEVFLVTNPARAANSAEAELIARLAAMIATTPLEARSYGPDA